MMKRNNTYLSPGRGPSPAELEKDSDFAECDGCGEWPGHCTCVEDDEDALEALREDYDDFRRDGIEDGYDGILGEG